MKSFIVSEWHVYSGVSEVSPGSLCWTVPQLLVSGGRQDQRSRFRFSLSETSQTGLCLKIAPNSSSGAGPRVQLGSSSVLVSGRRRADGCRLTFCPDSHRLHRITEGQCSSETWEPVLQPDSSKTSAQPQRSHPGEDEGGRQPPSPGGHESNSLMSSSCPFYVRSQELAGDTF